MDKEDLTILEREELLTSHAFRYACEELEKITGTPSDDWEQEMINRARNWLYDEIDSTPLDELSEEVGEEEAIA